ncbi:MAG: efflux RND transporter permease subunit [bacterium]|nr:MAG: efflux RND transporter permease subunit [bacterium]
MNLPEFSIKKPVTTMMVLVCLIVLGIVSLTRLSLDMFPDISFPHLWIRVPYQSSSPEEVERTIAIPVEDALGTVNHLKKITSRSADDGASVGVEFEWGTNMDTAALEVREMLDKVRAELPGDIENIYIFRYQSTDRPIMHTAVSIPGDRERLYQVVDKVMKPHLERIKGVANVEVRGLLEREVQVRLKEDLVKAFRINPYSIARDLRTGNFDLTVGKIYFGGKRYSVRTLGELENHLEVMRLPVRGGDIKLADFADVAFDYPEEERFQRIDNQRAVSVRIYKTSVANVVEVSRKVRGVLAELETDPRLEGIKMMIFHDQADEILKSIANLRQAGIIGGLLAVAVIMFFLRKLRSTLIIALAIPSSVVCTFILMYFLGVSINVISITGLALAAGMLVDNSVVVLESIYTQRQRGLPSRRAALEGSGRVALAITAATLTTIIVFVPLIFLSRSSFGAFMKDFGMTISTALVASLFVALTLIPLLSERMFRSEPKPKTRFVLFLEKNYTKLIAWTLHHRGLTLLFIGIVFGVSIWLARGIKREYMPEVPDRTARYTIQVPNGYPLQKLNERIGDFERLLLERKEEFEIENISSYLRRRRAHVWVFFKEAEERRGDIKELQRRVKELFPKTPGLTLEMGRRRGRHGGDLGISIEVTGKNPETLMLVADKIKGALWGIPGLADLQTDLETGVDEVRVRVDRELSSKYGLSPRAVAYTVSSAYSDRPVTRLEIEGNEVEVIVRYRESDRRNIARLDDMYIMNNLNEAVPLGAVADVEVVEGPAAISRENRRRMIRISANTETSGIFMVAGAIQKTLAGVQLPPGYEWRLGESWRLFQESERESGFAIIIAVILIYMLMASLFESLLHPFTIMCSIPFAFIGVAVIFRLTHTSLNNISTLGLMILCGIVVNNAIVLLHHVNRLRAEGLNRFEALMTGGRDRLRPILMAALTTILGLIPLAFFGGEGRGALWASMGKAVIGGLTASTFLTIILIPTFYSLFDDVAEWFKQAGRVAATKHR